MAHKMQAMTKSDILITASPAPTRRWIGVVVLVLLAFLFFVLAIAEATLPVWRFGFAGMGVIAFWGATAVWSVTRETLVLTRSELRTGGGEILVRVADIVAVDRGAFAFKPSQGFLLKSKTPGSRRWVPGVWWRVGRRIGVGGTLPGGQARAMAELITALQQGVLPEGDEPER